MICLPRHRLAVFSIAAVSMLAALAAAAPAAAKKRSHDAKKDQYALTARAPGKPVLALVSLDDQRVTIYDADGAILRAPVSSGQTGLETPVGIYAVLQKEAEHYSNVYDDAAMPHMERITWSGVALHGGALPGYPASHGCVRMPYKFAERLFGLTKLGMRVIVARDDVAPVPISHPLLFKRTPFSSSAGLVTKAAALVGIGQPQPGDEPADVAERTSTLQAIKVTKSAEADAIDKKAEPARALVKQRSPGMKSAKKVLGRAEKARERAAERVADAEKRLTRAKSDKAKERAEKAKTKADAKLAEAQSKLDAVKAEAQPKIDAYQEVADALKALDDKRDAARAEADEAARKLKPVSVFISLKTQKLYVRQNFQPVFESPVMIRDPEEPIGTHTYTAVAYGEDGRDMRWNVVSIGGGRGRARAVPYEDDYYDDDDYYGYYDRPRRRRHHARTTSKEPKPTDIAAAKAALDRITIPQDVVERISELVLQGTSLIVSDEAAHKETGKQTDFIVLISSEPQGGIMKRPRRMNPYYNDFYGYDEYYGGGYSRRGRRRGGGGFFPFW